MVADKNPLTAYVKMAEAIFYSSQMDPISIPEEYEEGSWESCDLTADGFGVMVQADQRPQQLVINE